MIEKQENTDLLFEDLKPVEMDIDHDKKNEPDRFSVKSDEGSSPKSSSPLRSSSRSRSLGKIETKREMDYDSDGEKY